MSTRQLVRAAGVPSNGVFPLYPSGRVLCCIAEVAPYVSRRENILCVWLVGRLAAYLFRGRRYDCFGRSPDKALVSPSREVDGCGFCQLPVVFELSFWWSFLPCFLYSKARHIPLYKDRNLGACVGIHCNFQISWRTGCRSSSSTWQEAIHGLDAEKQYSTIPAAHLYRYGTCTGSACCWLRHCRFFFNVFTICFTYLLYPSLYRFGRLDFIQSLSFCGDSVGRFKSSVSSFPIRPPFAGAKLLPFANLCLSGFYMSWETLKNGG